MTVIKRKILSKSRPQGQSFLELALVFGVLMLLMAGVVEYGFLLNEYLDTLDAAREAARYYSDSVPFTETTNVDGTITTNYGTPDLAFYQKTAQQAIDVMRPLTLDPTADDIVISIFSDAGGTAIRFPCGTDDGWHYYLSGGNYCAGNKQSRFSITDVEGRLDSTAPNSGLLLVEIFYDYHQVLQLPFMTNFMADPVTLQSYAFMPMSSAEPTPTTPP